MQPQAFIWTDIPAHARNRWWKLDRDNKRRLTAYYRKLAAVTGVDLRAEVAK